MEYVGRVPAPPLDRFIDDVYCLTGVPRHRWLNVPPMPSAHLFLHFGGPVRLRDSDPAVPPAVLTDGWFMGVWTRRFLVEYPARVRLVGVHFKPWGLSPFIGGPASELRNAQELAGERTVAVNAGEAGGRILAAGVVDEVAMDVVPVVFGSGKRYFGSIDGQRLLEDPHLVIQGDRVLHLKFAVRR